MKQPAEQVGATHAGRSARPITGRSSFSLIELLVVVAIILALVGIALKVTGVVNRQGGRARTLWVLEQVKNALGAYYTANGSYPPTSGVSCTLLKSGPSGTVPDGGWGEERGLAYYLYSAKIIPPHENHNPDPEAARWAHYLEKIGDYTWISNSKPSSANLTWVFWTNKVHWIADGWERNLNYTSSPPSYQEFRLWSSGPNGINENGGGDDIGVTGTE